MGHNHDGSITPDGKPFQRFQHAPAGLVVKSARGFVANQQARIVHQGPNNCHPLLLPTGKFDRQGLFPSCQTDILQAGYGSALRLILRDAVNEKRDCRIFRCGQRGNQVERLEDKINVSAPIDDAVIF